MALAPSHRAHHQPARAHGLVERAPCRRRHRKDAGPALNRLARAAGGDHRSLSCRPSRSGPARRRPRPLRHAHRALLGRRVARPLPAPALERRAQPGAHGRRCTASARNACAWPRAAWARPSRRSLELVPTSDRRTPTARDTARRNYLRLLERVLARHFIGAKVDGLRTAMDLEHSFGPAYVRGRLLKGTAADAVIGVGAAESGAVIDGVLTLGILWLDYCRQHADARRHFGGLKVVVPAGAWRTTAERMAWLNHAAADFELFTLDERSEELAPVDFRDTGNLDVAPRSRVFARRRPRALPSRNRPPSRARSRCRARARRNPSPLAPPKSACSCTAWNSPACATALRPTPSRAKTKSPSARAASETPLTAENEDLCRDLFRRLFLSRHADGAHTDPLFRMAPERWLESRLRTAPAELAARAARRSALHPGPRAFHRRPRHARPAHARPQRRASLFWN